MPSADTSKRAGFEAGALGHPGALRGLALRLTGGDKGRADGLVQEAVLRAVQSRDLYEMGTN